MFKGKYDMKYFLTSKNVKPTQSYKVWTRIAHIVLTERIGKRDPGNKPQPGDRIEYAAVCIENETKDTLQGDRIETPKFIKENNIDIDYLFYMKNQIRIPAIQFLELVVKNPEKMFDRFQVKAENKKKGQIDILKFIKKKKKKKKVSEESNLGGANVYIDEKQDVITLFKKRLEQKNLNV